MIACLQVSLGCSGFAPLTLNDFESAVAVYDSIFHAVIVVPPNESTNKICTVVKGVCYSDGRGSTGFLAPQLKSMPC